MTTFDTVLIISFIAMIALLGFAVFRNRNIAKTNEQIAKGQAHSIRLQERSVAAMERIADALEKR